MQMLTGTSDEVISRLIALGILINPKDDLIDLSPKFKTQSAMRTLEVLKGRAENLSKETFDQGMMLALFDFGDCMLSVNEITDFLNCISTWVKDEMKC